MRVPTGITLGAGLLLAVGVFFLSDSSPTGARLSERDATGSELPVLSAASAHAIPAGSRTAASEPHPQRESKGAHIRQLVAGRDPSDMFVAYKLVRTCLDAKSMEVAAKQNPQQFQVAPPEPVSACDGIDAGQLSSKLVYLRPAAQAGVHGALASFVMEGPDGTGPPEGPNAETPIAREWWLEVEKLVRVGAANGDVYSLQALAVRYENDASVRDLRLSWAYWIAANQMQIATTGEPFRSFDRMAVNVTRSLSEEDRLLSEKMARELLSRIRREKR